MILFQDIDISVYGRIWLFQGFIIPPSHVTPWLSIGFTRHLQLLLTRMEFRALMSSTKM